MADDVAALLAKRFISRRDVMAVQHADGSYEPERRAIKMGDLRAHLAGERTIGHYVLDTDDKCKFFCYDLDLVEGWPDPADPKGPKVPLPWDHGATYRPLDVWRSDPDPNPDYEDILMYLRVQLHSAAAGLGEAIRAKLGIPVAVAYSGNKGIHVYGFTGHTEAAKARKAALLILGVMGNKSWQPWKGQHFFRSDAFPVMSMEVFPKQDSLAGKDLGNLLRLPLGINQKSGGAGFFLKCNGDWHTPFESVDPERALETGDPWA